MKTRAKDLITLSSGQTMTLGEAIGHGHLTMIAVNKWDGQTNDLSQAKRFVAREKNGDLFWEINKTYFQGFYG